MKDKSLIVQVNELPFFDGENIDRQNPRPLVLVILATGNN